MVTSVPPGRLPRQDRRRGGLPWGALLLWLGAQGIGCAQAPDFEPLIAAEDKRQVAAPALSAATAAGDSRLRARAAVAYGRIGQAPGIAPLINLLADPEPAVRQAAAFALGQFGWFDARKGHEAEIRAGLRPLLADSDAGVRSHAIEAVGKMADPATATALATPLLADPDPAARAEAALALHRSRQLARANDPTQAPPRLPDDTLAALQALGMDQAVEVRRAAVYYFARNLDSRGRDLAQQLATDPDVWVRLFSVQALKRIADASALPAVLTAATDADYTVRVAAVQALSALQEIDKLPPQLLSDPSFHVRAAIADAYAAASQAAVDDQVLVGMFFSDPSPTVRTEALLGLAARRQAAAAPFLMMALTDDNAQLRIAAVSSAGSLASADATVLLKRGLRDPVELVRVAALGQLGSVPDAWAHDAIIQAARFAAGLAERSTAAGVLSLRSEPDRVAAAWQSYRDSPGHGWRDVRTALLDVFAGDPSGDSTDHLRTAATDPEPEVSTYARGLLMMRGITDLPAAPPDSFAYSPFYSLRFAENPVVAIATTRGTFEVECFAADAPVHVASFIGLVRQGTYNGLPFHRVVSNFVIQGGDPEGSGYGDAGFSLRLEVNEHRFARGALGMPRGNDFDSGGSQLFFNHIPTPHLDGQYTVFGQIRSGLDVVDQVEQGDVIVSARVLD